MKPTPRQYQEAVERTKKIKEHLIKEGYAENEESAESIRSIDNHFGEGYAKKNPELVSRMMGIMDNTSGRNGGNIAEYR